MRSDHDRTLHDSRSSLIERVLSRTWFYEFDLPDGRRTTSYLPTEVRGIHTSRLAMLVRTLDDHLGTDWSGKSCLDMACHEGWFSSHLAGRGMRVLGIDARAEHVTNARLMANTCGTEGATFMQRDISTVGTSELGQFDVVLMLGLLYHLENPVHALRLAFSHTTDLCVVETQIAPHLTGPIDWGSARFVKRMIGNFAIVDETRELNKENSEANTTTISLVPSLEGLLWIMRAVGFSRVTVIEPPEDAYEQLRFGKRVMVAGSVEPGVSRRPAL